ncbi:MAG: 16S rRNA (guanine(527)-N(7))-methyltransferase RsmG [Epsilonproteobacteria bacterium]|nr:16S rRNA (guanine(527)-N(7))-methyltransferase RsmG [Campylobacterota bacterium]
MQNIDQYIELLLKWNKTHSVTNYDKQALQQQIQLTIKALDYIDTTDIQTAIDIGSGAGIPGMILAIAMPQTTWYLIEPLKKRFSFLNYAKIKLNLSNVNIIPSRIEQIQPFKVDLITSRAVKHANFLLQLSQDFMDSDTVFLLYKGENATQEAKNLPCDVQIYKNQIQYMILRDCKKGQ